MYKQCNKMIKSVSSSVRSEFKSLHIWLYNFEKITKPPFFYLEIGDSNGLRSSITIVPRIA